MTRADQKLLRRELRREFGEENVSARRLYPKVTLPSGIKMDVQPHRSTYMPRQVLSLSPDRFRNNPKGREAVRNLKKQAQQNQHQWNGQLIEMSVIMFQQTHKGAKNFEIEKGLGKLLHKAAASDNPKQAMRKLLGTAEKQAPPAEAN